MEGLHPHDSRNLKCAAPGCMEKSFDIFCVTLNNRSNLHYCSSDCAIRHELYLKKHLPELGPERGV